MAVKDWLNYRDKDTYQRLRPMTCVADCRECPHVGCRRDPLRNATHLQ
jgi:hypothetical protein